MTPGAPLSGERIIMFSTADWDTALPTNKHHLARRLARANRVLFVETLGTRAPQIGSSADTSRIVRRLRRGLAGPTRRDRGLWSVSPLVLPRWDTPVVRALNRAAFQISSRAPVGRFMERVVWAYSPYAAHLLPRRSPHLLVYHMVDDLAAVPGADVRSLREAESLLFARADAVFCTERSLLDRARAGGADAHLMPNVADFDHFSNPAPRSGRSATLRARIRALRGPRLVFSGHLASHKVDLGLLIELVRRRPSWSFVLIGPRWEADPRQREWARLAAAPNVLATGHVDYDDLPPLLHEADALLIPYALTDATRGVFPLKLFEYFATGRPVVATDSMDSLRPYGDVCVLAGGGAAAWETAIASALREPLERAQQRRELARRNTWEARLAQMDAVLAQVLAARARR